MSTKITQKREKKMVGIIAKYQYELQP